MSVAKSEPKSTRKASRKPAKTQETVLSALLAQTEEVSVPLDSLIKSPLNVRTVPYSAESVSELADSIKGVGLLQNLVVHALPGDRYGVAAGGRRLAALNMFSDDGDGYVDRVALDAALLEKLQAVAEFLREAEGWGWCAGRMEPVGECREDAGIYRCLPEPEAVLTEAEEERLNELMARYDALENQCEESDLLEAEMKLMRCMAKVRAWTPEMRAGGGVVVSWRYGNVCVQRGVQLRSEDDAADDADRTEQVQEKASVEEISLPLLTKMSSERTLAVQVALMQQPDKSLTLLAWTLCLNVFGSGAYSKPAQISLECKHYSLTSDAPSGKEGAAFMALMAEKVRLAALLPEGWSRDMTTFLSLSQEVLLSLLSFCTACSLNGVQTRECGHTSRSPLDTLETAIGFHMRDWWQPTKANFFGYLKKPQIIAALNEAGLSGAARDAEKMKKGDAAEHAEFHMKDNRWVPGWMCAPRPQTDATERTDNLADAA
ncbi:TPA: ParB/Srx family N-terminal domain-containing protein [Escherichia coli]